MTETMKSALADYPDEMYLNDADLKTVKAFAKQVSLDGRSPITGICTILMLEDGTYFALASEHFPFFVQPIEQGSNRILCEKTGEFIGTFIGGYDTGEYFDATQHDVDHLILTVTNWVEEE